MNQAGNDHDFTLRDTVLVSTEAVGSPPKGGTYDRDIDELGELPRSYGRPLLVAIARDPQTLFAYWDVNWPVAFGDAPPVDRSIHMRLLKGDVEESRMQVEPLAGSGYVPVLCADVDYRVELGYYQPAGEWHSVAISRPVLTPRNSVKESVEFELVTVPLHLNFQRMVEIFRGSKYDGQALSDAIAKLQRDAESGEVANASAAEETGLIQSLGWILSQIEATARAAFRTAANEERISAAQLDRILGADSRSVSSSGGS